MFCSKCVKDEIFPLPNILQQQKIMPWLWWGTNLKLWENIDKEQLSLKVCYIFFRLFFRFSFSHHQSFLKYLITGLLSFWFTYHKRKLESQLKVGQFGRSWFESRGINYQVFCNINKCEIYIPDRFIEPI